MMEFFHAAFKLLFYAGLPIYIFFEVFALSNYDLFQRIGETAKAITKRDQERAEQQLPPIKREWDTMTDDERGMSITGKVLIFYWVWAVLGLFTSNWPAFLILVLLACLTSTLPSIIKKTRAYQWFDGLLSLVLLIFIGVNAYQLHLGWHDLLHFIR